MTTAYAGCLHKINRLDDLLPWNWTPIAATQAEAA